MKQKRWTKRGVELKKENPTAFTSGCGPNSMPTNGGAHKRATDYKRSDKKSEERRAKRGDFE